MEPPESPRKDYGFKERTFKRDNAPGQPAMPTAKELAIMAGHTTPSARTGATPKAGDPNDVLTVLHGNRVIEQQAGLNEVEIREVKSRRKRDFWMMLVGGNLLIVGLVFLTGVNIVSVMFGLAGVIILSLGLTWVMWQVMGRY